MNVPNDSPTQAAYIQRHLKPLLHRLYLALPALLLPHDRNLGKHSRQDIIKGSCQKFLAGQWRSLYDLAIKAFALKRPRTANNDPDHLQQRKNKRALILTKKGNLSKAYKTLTQDGLVDHDAIETLRKQHRREHMPLLDLHSSLTQDIQDNTDWSKLISADAIYKHVRKQKNGKAPDRHGMRPDILKCLLDSPQIFDLYHKHILLYAGGAALWHHIFVHMVKMQ